MKAKQLIFILTGMLLFNNCNLKNTDESNENQKVNNVDTLKTGSTTKIIEFYASGELKAIRSFVNEKKEQGQYFFHENGVLSYQAQYRNGERQGLSAEYYNNGVPMGFNFMSNGKLNGMAKGYHKNGNLRFDGYYKAGQKIDNWIDFDTTGMIIYK